MTIINYLNRKIVEEEAELEGQFVRAHGRIIQHAEEISFLKGQQVFIRIFTNNIIYLSIIYVAN